MNDDLDYDTISGHLSLLGIRFRSCEVCGKKIVTALINIDRVCEDCYQAQQDLNKKIKEQQK